MMFLARIALAFILGVSALTPALPAHADGFRLPDPTDYCGTPAIIERLKSHVDHKFREYTKTKLFLVEVIDPTEVLDRPSDETHTVTRKWCHAKARMTDRKTRDMWYLLEKRWAFAGAPFMSSAEFCIAGLDPWKIYGKDCSTIRNTIGWE